MTEYYYAFLNEEGVVTNVLLFGELLPEELKGVFLEPQNAIDCVLQTEETGLAYIGGDMKDGKFRPQEPEDAIAWCDEHWWWETPPLGEPLPPDPE